MAFDVDIELADIRRQQDVARRRRHYKRRLDRYRAEIVALRRAGATLQEIVAWLRRRRCKVAASTVCRYLAKLPELGGGDNAEF